MDRNGTRGGDLSESQIFAPPDTRGLESGVENGSKTTAGGCWETAAADVEVLIGRMTAVS